jgi:hypothetical protein
MIDRRSFMTGSAALAAAIAAGRAGHGAIAPAEAAAAAASPVLALVDRLLDGAEPFAAKARASGLRVLEFASDAASVWMRELEPRLRAGPIVVTGHTSAATLFCLDVMARDYGTRVVERADTGPAVTWTMSSMPARRAALVPTAEPRWSHSHA